MGDDMKKRKIVVIIQARMGSKRFPGKVIEKIGDKTLLEILVKRIKNSKLVDDIVIATTYSKRDDTIVKQAEKIDTNWFRGDEEDVLRRYVEASKVFGADIVVRVTADNPLTDTMLMDKLVKRHLEADADYTYCDSVPLGVSVEVINHEILRKIDEKAKQQPDREHVTLYIKLHPEDFKIQKVDSGLDNADIRLTVDTREDLELMRKIYKNLGDFERLEIRDVITFLKRNPEICKINAQIRQNIPNLNMVKPKVSVIIRTHNSSKFVRNALKSVLDQILSKDFYEVLVVDDGSTDNTKEILMTYKDKIKIIEEKDLGPVKAINVGITYANEYVILLDSDDIFKPTILKEMYDILEKETNFAFVYCDYFEKKLEKGETKVVFLRDNIFNSVAGGIMFRKSILDDIGGYDESLIFPEYDLLIKIMKKYKGIHISKPLFTYVRHEVSLTANQELVKKGVKQLFDKYGKIKDLRDY